MITLATDKAGRHSLSVAGKNSKWFHEPLRTLYKTGLSELLVMTHLYLVPCLSTWRSSWGHLRWLQELLKADKDLQNRWYKTGTGGGVSLNDLDKINVPWRKNCLPLVPSYKSFGHSERAPKRTRVLYITIIVLNRILLFEIHWTRKSISLAYLT